MDPSSSSSMARAGKSRFNLCNVNGKGLQLLCHIPVLAVYLCCALKAEIIPRAGKFRATPHLELPGLSTSALSWGFFIHHLVTLVNNDHKPVPVHTRSKSLLFCLSALVANVELVISLQVCCSPGLWEWQAALQNHTEILEMLLLFCSHSAAFLLLAVQQVHRTWAMGLLPGGLWPKPPPCRGSSCPSLD